MKPFFLLTFAVSAMAVSAANYVKVTATPADWAGTYLIVCESQSVVFNGGASEDNLDAKQGPAILTEGFAFSNDSLLGTEAVDTATFTIAATEDADWPWSIQTQSGYFIGHKDTADNGLSVETEVKKKCRHTLSVDDNGNLIATPRYEVAGPYNLQYNKKSDQMRFRYFEPEDKVAIQIYKRVSAPTALRQLTDSPSPRFTKVIRDGRMLIIKDGKEISVLGN